MKSQAQNNENFIYDRLFLSMSASEKSSFTKQQKSYLYEASKKLAPRKHSINVRMSIPIPYRAGVYFVFLAGQERRNKARIRWERQMFWRFLAMFLGVLALVASIVFGKPVIYHLNSMPSQASAPTALPWIDGQQECQKFERVWEDGTCWDEQHDSAF